MINMEVHHTLSISRRKTLKITHVFALVVLVVYAECLLHKTVDGRRTADVKWREKGTWSSLLAQPRLQSLLVTQ